MQWEQWDFADASGFIDFFREEGDPGWSIELTGGCGTVMRDEMVALRNLIDELIDQV